MKGRKVAVSMT